MDAARPPSSVQRIEEDMMCLLTEKLRLTLNESLKEYDRISFPFIDYLGSLSFLINVILTSLYI